MKIEFKNAEITFLADYWIDKHLPDFIGSEVKRELTFDGADIILTVEVVGEGNMKKAPA